MANVSRTRPRIQKSSKPSEEWRQFIRRDGTIVRCLIMDGHLQHVVMEDKQGNAVDVPPQMADIGEITKGLGFRPKLFRVIANGRRPKTGRGTRATTR